MSHQPAPTLKSLAGQKVLVTGGSGFIGAPLCRALQTAGARVVSLSRNPKAADGIETVSVDLSDSDATSAAMARYEPDTLFHLAGHVYGKRDMEVVQSTLASNLLSTVNLLQAAVATGCSKVILTGSLEEPDPQTDWSVPSSPYAAAKSAAGSYGRMFHALYDLPVVILRVFMVYGPGQADHTKLVPYVTNALLRGESPKLSSGTRLVDWVYRDDVVAAYLLAAQQPDIAGKTIDVGSGRLHSVADIVSALYARLAPEQTPALGSGADRPMEQVRTADTERTRALLGWQPCTSLEAGIDETIEWYRQQLSRDHL